MMNLFSPVLAQGIRNNFLGTNLSNMLDTGDGSGYINRLINVGVSFALIVGGLYFAFMFIFGGISYMSSGGDKAKVEAAQAKLRNSFFGLLVLFSFFAIAGLVSAVFGVNILFIDVTNLLIR